MRKCRLEFFQFHRTLISRGIGPVDDGVEKHVAARRAIILSGALHLIVADAVLAGHKDHARRR